MKKKHCLIQKLLTWLKYLLKKNNDQNVLNSDDLLEELQERSSGESELNKSLYISPEEDDGIDLREQISVFKEKRRLQQERQ